MLFIKSRSHVRHFYRFGKTLRHLLLSTLLIAGLVLPSPKAHAICFPCVNPCTLIDDLTDLIPDLMLEIIETTILFNLRLEAHKIWLRTMLLDGLILPVLQNVGEQMTTVGMHQTLAIGTFIDGAQQMETQREIQRLTARAHKDYHPSLGICTFGTTVRSLAEADSRIAFTKAVLDEQSIKRQLGSANVSASEGPRIDIANRIDLFSTRFCDRYENNRLETPIAGSGTEKPRTGLEMICDAASMGTAVNKQRITKDTDFLNTILLPRTIKSDFFDPAPDPDDINLFALGNNLYAHEPLMQIASPLLSSKEHHDNYLEFRSIIAKRSIAENALHSIISLKSMGRAAAAGTAGSSEQTRQYLDVLLEELGMSQQESRDFLGQRPSYLAQMEVLAKKMYQREGFYVDLYDKPVNVERRRVAMQAISLMLDRDIYNSNLRSEAIMSLLLEMRLIDAQDAVKNNMGKLRANVRNK